MLVAMIGLIPYEREKYPWTVPLSMVVNLSLFPPLDSIWL